ncbi:MAG: DUF4242 domain-containing protein [Chitinophagaceae bacterium]|jgi:hypothetical protein|nr:DUF4242 domain-containing protein [Chitinophagaceae bacterium]
MNKIIHRLLLLSATVLFTTMAIAQNTGDAAKTKNNSTMKTYLIERDIPGASTLTPADLKGISQKSCSVLKEMGPKIQWQHSYVAGNKVFCVYKAENPELLREHAQKGGFPITSITEIANVISPATANQ